MRDTHVPAAAESASDPMNPLQQLQKTVAEAAFHAYADDIWDQIAGGERVGPKLANDPPNRPRN
jgi:hypothetical protein